MNDNKAFLGTEPIGKLMFKLSLPTVVAQLINMLYNIVDRIYIGHIPGDGNLAFTGLGVCLPIIMIVTAFAALVGSGGAPRASIFMGQKNYQAAERTLGQCFTLQLVISAVLTFVLLMWNEPILYAFGASENTIAYATGYMKIYAIGTLFVQVTLGMNAFITAQGFTKVSMLAVLIGAVTNIVLDPILIFGFHMGVQGAALATIFSQALSCIWVLCFLLGKKTVLKIKKSNLRLTKKIILPCVALGTSAFIMQSSESIISVCFNVSLRGYGGDIAVGAMSILASVMQFAMLPLQGIAMGAQPITSYNYGARNGQRVRKTVHLLLISCMTYSTLLWASVMAFPAVFAGIFTPDPEMTAFTAPMLRIFIGGLFLMGLQIGCQMTFIALGYTKSSITVAVVRKFVLLLPMIYLLPHLMSDKVKAVYMAEPVSDILAVTFTAVLFFFQFRKAMKSLENPAEK